MVVMIIMIVQYRTVLYSNESGITFFRQSLLCITFYLGIAAIHTWSIKVKDNLILTIIFASTSSSISTLHIQFSKVRKTCTTTNATNFCYGRCLSQFLNNFR